MLLNEAFVTTSPGKVGFGFRIREGILDEVIDQRD